MITTLKDAKARLSELVTLAASGEEVVITVRGKPRARMSSVPAASAVAQPGWKKELEKLHRKYRGAKSTLSSEEIVDQLRQERS